MFNTYNTNNKEKGKVTVAHMATMISIYSPNQTPASTVKIWIPG